MTVFELGAMRMVCEGKARDKKGIKEDTLPFLS